MSNDRSLDKEVMVYMHNVILLNKKKTLAIVTGNNIDGHGGISVMWSKSEKKKHKYRMA